MRKIFFYLFILLVISCTKSNQELETLKLNEIILSNKIITERNLNGLNKEELRIYRNTIYAKHGYIFRSNDLREYFSQFNWYKSNNENVDHLLTANDLKNIRFIQEYEKQPVEFIAKNTNIKQPPSIEVKYSEILGFDGYLFPSAIISTALSNVMERISREYNSIGINRNNLGCNIFISSSSRNMHQIPVRLEIEGESIISKSVLETTINPNINYKLFPNIIFNYQYLENVIQPRLENITYKIYCFNELKATFTKTIQFRSINEVPFLYIDDNDDYLNLSYLFAAYVNEDNPIIDELLRDALNIGIINVIDGTKRNDNSFSGYQKDEYGVLDQVFAIWNVLQRRGIKYSSITTTSSERTRVISQYVRSLTDTLASNQANCVDGSVLFASILRKIGIDTFLVLIPGHMMVGFWVDKSNTEAVVIETTAIGHENLDDYFDDKTFFFGGLTRLLGSSRNEVSRESFVYAIQNGTKKYEDNLDNFNNIYNRNYEIIDISQLRREGIKPIPR